MTTPQHLPSAGDGSEAPQRGGDTPRTWRIEFPPRQELLNANDRLHWRPKNRITQQIRGDAFKLAKAAKIPPLNRVYVEGIYEPPDRRKRDAANWYPSFKAAIDGALVDTKTVPDDDSKHVIGPDMRLGEPCPGGRIVLVITELSDFPQEND